MNKTNGRRARVLAGKIEKRARRIVSQMEAIQATNLNGVSLATVQSTFTNLENHWGDMQAILAEMLPQFENE